jgi:hypothetical protein
MHYVCPSMNFLPFTRPTHLNVRVPDHCYITAQLMVMNSVYPECAQLIVTGNGTATPPASMTIKLPGDSNWFLHRSGY